MEHYFQIFCRHISVMVTTKISGFPPIHLYRRQLLAPHLAVWCIRFHPTNSTFGCQYIRVQGPGILFTSEVGGATPRMIKHPRQGLCRRL